MSQPNKRPGIGFSAEKLPESPTVNHSPPPFNSHSPSQKCLILDPASSEFIEGQTLYAKIKSEIQAQFLTEAEAAFRKTVTAKMKAEIRHGMILDVEEESRKLLVKQKEKMVEGIRKEVRKEIEKEMGEMGEREERMRERIRREVREELREERERELEDARREVRYEYEESIRVLEERYERDA
jgi:hypothetical protein